jgi:hypothetical protein
LPDFRAGKTLATIGPKNGLQDTGMMRNPLTTSTAAMGIAAFMKTGEEKRSNYVTTEILWREQIHFQTSKLLSQTEPQI